MGFLDSIGGGAADFIGGLVGVNTRPMPSLNQAQMDPDTRAIYGQRVQQANAPAQDTENQIVADQTRGINSGANFLRGGGVGSPMGKAIQDRQNRQFGNTTGSMVRQDMINAPAARFSRIADTLGAVQKDAQNALAFSQNQKLAEQNYTFARNQALSSILGGAGSLFGGAIGGAGGAALGGAAGRGVASVNGPQGNVNYLGGGTVPGAYQ